MAEVPRLEPAHEMISGGEWETTIYLETEANPSGRAPSTLLGRALMEYARPKRLAIQGSMGLFLENGGHTYIDTGDRLEICTPEEKTPQGAAQREIDDEHFAAEMVANAVNDPKSEIIGGAVYKRTYSSGRTLVKEKSDGTVRVVGYTKAESCGKHLNTGLPQVPGFTGIAREHLGPMGLHAATSALYLGSGAVFAHDRSGVHARFGLHQRAPFVADDYSSATMRNRPVVNLRNEPLVPKSESQEWVRFHNINSDACLSPWAMRMAYGTDRLVLRLGLAGENLEEYEPGPQSPLFRIFKQTAFDMTHKKTVELYSGTITPLQIQQVLYEKCNELTKRYELCEDELWTLDQWGRALADFEANPKLLYDRTDWVIKHHTLQKYKEKHGIAENDWTDPMLEVIDTDYSLLKPGSRGMKMRAGAWAKWLPSTEVERTDAQRRMPPQETRARIRGEVVRRYGALPCSYGCKGCANCRGPHRTGLSVGWTRLAAGDASLDARVRIEMNPFDTDISVLDALAQVVAPNRAATAKGDVDLYSDLDYSAMEETWF